MQAPNKPTDADRRDGTFNDLVAINNALSKDDPDGLQIVAARDCLLPAVDVLCEWMTPVTCVFALGYGGIVGRAGPDSIIVRTPCRDGTIAYNPKDDASNALSSLGIPLARGALAESTLTRAVACGSRRCIRALVDAGARPNPSIEALVAVALDRLFWDAVAVVDCHKRTASHPCTVTWNRHVDRAIDGVSILGDLLAAFPRSAALHPLDVNPLTVLRTVVAGGDRLGGVTTTSSTLVPLYKRVDRAVEMLLRAGYSPDEPLAHIPLRPSLYGARPCHGEMAESTVDGHLNPDGGSLCAARESLAAYRTRLVATTERQATQCVLARMRLECLAWAGDPVVLQGMDVIHKAYGVSNLSARI
ncbi:hypothetical protein psal_cds_701 [Pandoravirus salinus]|uniref:Uncharacterized protein n=1 Tax=Pandoravirus salinus TaxID=1349410 RepID=S4W2E9_9VIRU|nr:hypothetical protein psal_cds_701 [Pandoravirus salinus]AGO84657.1 hypothetical protein psal_cds_701 [Pandoravirus salinus]